MNRDQQIAAVVDKWFEVVKVRHDEHATAFVLQCQSVSVELNDKTYTYYQRGSGPTVILIHGLFSNLGSMAGIARDLVAQGFKVVLFDAPAHGEAIGTSTDPVEIRDLIRTIGKQFTDTHAIICHSLGVMWALAAWNKDFRAKTLISISGLSSKKYLVDRFIEKYQIDAEIADGFIKELENRFGETVWSDFSPSERVRTIDIPGLIIHGRNDDVVPPSHAEDLQSNWRQGRVEMIDGVGHFDVVRSPKVRQLITRYLREFEPSYAH
jgi:pimeloyl-ACP methyl ester carboxylesterase